MTTVFIISKFCIWATSWQNQQNGMCAQQRLRSAWASARSIRVFAARMTKVWVLRYPLSAQRRLLIRLGGCPGWSESSLSAQAILLVLLWGSSFDIYQRQASVFSPPMFMEHDPHIPSLHDLLKVKVGSTVSLILIKASNTIGPHLEVTRSLDFFQ